MEPIREELQIGLPAKIGSSLIYLWGFLHIWVGAEGLHQYLKGDAKSMWNMFIGGSSVPKVAFQHSADLMTAFAHKQVLVNFAIDVGGYGVLGIALAYLIGKKASWTAYLLTVFVIGIADLAFLFSQVTSGVIELNAGTVGGPVIWLLAIMITPFGLPKRNLQWKI